MDGQVRYESEFKYLRIYFYYGLYSFNLKFDEVFFRK